MKIAFFLALIFLISCKESTSEFDSLDPRDQAYIRRISTEQCISENQRAYTNFKTESAKVFTNNAGFKRGEGFYHEFKTSNFTRTVDVRVWKRTVDYIIFYITEKNPSTNQYFLRITPAQNAAMIDSLLVEHCKKPTDYVSSTGTNGPLTIKDEYEQPVAPNEERFTDIYTLNFSYPAYFASYHLNRTVKTFNSSDDQVGDAVTYTATTTAKSYTFDSAVATDANYYTQKFCEIDAAADDRFIIGEFGGYALKDPCEATPTGADGAWNVTP